MNRSTQSRRGVTRCSDLYFLPLKPGFCLMVCAHCLRRPPRSNGHPTVVPCIFFSLIAAGLAHSLERRRLVVLFCNFADFLFCRVHLNQVHRKFGRKTRRGAKKPSLKNNSPRKNLLNNNPRKRTHRTKKRWVVWTAGFNLKSVFHCFSLIWGGYDMASCNCS